MGFSFFDICGFVRFTGAFMRERGCGYNPKDPEKGKRIRIMRVTSEPNLVTLFFFFARKAGSLMRKLVFIGGYILWLTISSLK